MGDDGEGTNWLPEDDEDDEDKDDEDKDERGGRLGWSLGMEDDDEGTDWLPEDDEEEDGMMEAVGWGRK